jgi:hypothetical protein
VPSEVLRCQYVYFSTGKASKLSSTFAGASCPLHTHLYIYAYVYVCVYIHIHIYIVIASTKKNEYLRGSFLPSARTRSARSL